MKIPPILGVQNWGYISELALQEGVFFRFGESNELHCFYLLYFYYMPFPAKVKRCAESLQSGPCYRGQARLRTTSQSASQTAPLVGEPLAKPFTLRGLPKPPLLGATATTAACATSGTLLFTGMKRLFLPAVSCFLMKTPPCS